MLAFVSIMARIKRTKHDFRLLGDLEMCKVNPLGCTLPWVPVWDFVDGGADVEANSVICYLLRVYLFTVSHN